MITTIIGLGNPGKAYYSQRHSIGFRVLDNLAEKYEGIWKTKDKAEYAQITINNRPILLVKPQTFMNNSGEVIPWLQKQGVKPENMLVVHDELELPMGKIALKKGGSAKGHNGLKSIISFCGDQFWRLKFGIGRPKNREEVPNYVLAPFSEPESQVRELIEKAVAEIENVLEAENEKRL